MYNSCAQWYAHTWEQFLNLHVGLGLDFGFVCLFRFTILYAFYVSLDHIISVLGLVSSVPSQEIGWEERLQKDLFCVEWDVKP